GEAAGTDRRGPGRGKERGGLGDGPAEPIGGNGRLARGPARVAGPEIGRRGQVPLGPADQLSPAVVNVVGAPPALVLLGSDDLLDERGERALARGLLPPGP